MPIILNPADTAEPPTSPCEDLIVVSPQDATSLYDCPIKVKTRTIVVDAGQEATVNWEMRDREGNTIDLSGCLVDPGSGDPGGIVVRFQNALDNTTSNTILETTGTPVAAQDGLIAFDLPADLVAAPGVFNVQIGVKDENGRLVFSDRGLVSVERGMFGADPADGSGPITIGEVRIQLRDFLVSNNLRDIVEFDDVEIIHAIVQPLMQWNEVPPPIGYVTPYSCPWRFHWLRATCAILLRIASAWYLRNKLNVTHGGVQDDDLNRNNEYLQLGLLYQKEWEEWMYNKKREINITLAYGSIS